MKLDLILENIRNTATLNLLEESSAINADEKEVLKGKIFINESTVMLRGLLIEENVMETVKAVVHQNYADLFEEAVHAANPKLDKNKTKDSNANKDEAFQVRENRAERANDIKIIRGQASAHNAASRPTIKNVLFTPKSTIDANVNRANELTKLSRDLGKQGLVKPTPVVKKPSVLSIGNKVSNGNYAKFKADPKNSTEALIQSIK